jgi:hypothetical protein
MLQASDGIRVLKNQRSSRLFFKLFQSPSLTSDAKIRMRAPAQQLSLILAMILMLSS